MHTILLTGATGYIGGRLLGRLEAAGHHVRCLARNPAALRARAGPRTEIVQGDVRDAGALDSALAGVHTAYYLVHSMGAGEDYADEDRRAAVTFGEAARRAGVQRIIYLGALARPDTSLSKHLRSRLETGAALRATGVPVVELRASIVIGSGSLSFEMIRALVERLPVMICPRWVRTPAQPIGIEDLLDYLVAALALSEGNDRVFEIGGSDQASYGDLMREYARQRGLRRLMISVPLLTPRLSSLWLGLVTPIYARVGRELIEGLRNPSVVMDPSAAEIFPVRPASLRSSIARALRNEDREYAATRWSDALSSGGRPAPYGGRRFGTRLVDRETALVNLPAEVAFAPVERIGGAQGWYYGNTLWRIRGFLDLLVGGVGMRRGRRHPTVPSLGDTIDFWRVEAYEPARRLRLRAEMKLPGRAWLEFEAVPDEAGRTVLHQSAIFDPLGLAGLVYWYGLYPVHRMIFRGMLRAIARTGRSPLGRRKPAPFVPAG